MTAAADDPFQVLVGANFGIGRAFYELVGGFDESFTRWGLEDTEFGWRAYTRGGVLLPVREAFAWHQGRWAEGRKPKQRSRELQRAKAAHLIAHEGFRDARPGCVFAVPRYAVTLEAGDEPAGRLVEAVETVLADPVHDLVVRVPLRPGDARLEALRDRFGPEPRVCVGPADAALDAFPATPFHVALPAGARLPRGVVQRLRDVLGSAAAAETELSDGARVSITRAWALHRGRRTRRPAADFGDAVAIPARRLGIPRALRRRRAQAARGGRRRGRMGRVVARIGRIRTPRQAWWFLAWLGQAVSRRLARSGAAGRAGAPAALRRQFDPPAGDAALGAEIVALGSRARAVFAASPRVAPRLGGHADVVVSDVPLAGQRIEAPAVSLADAPPRLSVPAFDPRIHNPIGWRRDVDPVVAVLGPRDRLPSGVGARRLVRSDDREGLRRVHHLEDVQARHADVVGRAGLLARLAAAGVVVHLADQDPRLRACLGHELHDLMTAGLRAGDRAGRERLSIRMRRAALRDHALGSRVRQVCAAAALADPPRVPLVSVLLVTRRPGRLDAALAAVARQTYPRLELVLGLHGDGFTGVESRVAGLSRLAGGAKIVRIDGRLPLGSALNAATSASSGTLVAKMDDDEVYGAEHLWDLVLAHEYSQAQLVGKGTEFVYLAESNRTLRTFQVAAESFSTSPAWHVAGGALLVTRHALDQVGGWRRVRCGEDGALQADIVRAGGRVYRTHGAGFVHVRHGQRHAWEVEDDWFLLHAEAVAPGWNPALADLPGTAPPPPPAGSARG